MAPANFKDRAIRHFPFQKISFDFLVWSRYSAFG
jgi:hypothetical protein